MTRDCTVDAQKPRWKDTSQTQRTNKRGAKEHTHVFDPFKPSRQGHRYATPPLQMRPQRISMMRHEKKHRIHSRNSRPRYSMKVHYFNLNGRTFKFKSDNRGEYTSKEFLEFLENTMEFNDTLPMLTNLLKMAFVAVPSRKLGELS